MSSEYDVSWDEIESFIKILSKKISKMPRTFTSITTLSRGGLVPSRLLADHLGIDKIFVDKKKISANSLFVDDIFDSGNTFKKIISKAEDPKFLVYATLFARIGKDYPDQLIYATQTKGTEYIVFPWEKFEHRRLLDAQK